MHKRKNILIFDEIKKKTRDIDDGNNNVEAGLGINFLYFISEKGMKMARALH